MLTGKLQALPIQLLVQINLILCDLQCHFLISLLKLYCSIKICCHYTLIILTSYNPKLPQLTTFYQLYMTHLCTLCPCYLSKVGLFVMLVFCYAWSFCSLCWHLLDVSTPPIMSKIMMQVQRVTKIHITLYPIVT